MKTLADLKRDLKPWVQLQCDYHWKESMKDKERIVAKVNTVWIKFENGVFLDFPKVTTQLEYKWDTFTIWTGGKVPLTDIEKQHIKNAHETYTEEEYRMDMMTDTSICYWRKKKYFEENGVDYLMSVYWDERTDDKAKINKMYTFTIIQK